MLFLGFLHYHDINRILRWHYNSYVSHEGDGAGSDPMGVSLCGTFGFERLHLFGISVVVSSSSLTLCLTEIRFCFECSELCLMGVILWLMILHVRTLLLLLSKALVLEFVSRSFRGLADG